jgi:hypothetical protein
MWQEEFLYLLAEANLDVSIVSSLSDFVCFAVVCADTMGRGSYSDWLRSGKSNFDG